MDGRESHQLEHTAKSWSAERPPLLTRRQLVATGSTASGWFSDGLPGGSRPARPEGVNKKRKIRLKGE